MRKFFRMAFPPFDCLSGLCSTAIHDPPPFGFFGAIEIAPACHDRICARASCYWIEPISRCNEAIGGDVRSAQDAFQKKYDILGTYGKEGTDMHA
jgi:hypothetical protein